MDLMEILKALFGGEVLTFEQFAEKVNNGQMLSSATLQAVNMLKRRSTMMYQISLQVETQILRVMTPTGRIRLSRHRPDYSQNTKFSAVSLI